MNTSTNNVILFPSSTKCANDDSFGESIVKPVDTSSLEYMLANLPAMLRPQNA